MSLWNTVSSCLDEEEEEEGAFGGSEEEEEEEEPMLKTKTRSLVTRIWRSSSPNNKRREQTALNE